MFNVHRLQLYSPDDNWYRRYPETTGDVRTTFSIEYRTEPIVEAFLFLSHLSVRHSTSKGKEEEVANKDGCELCT